MSPEMENVMDWNNLAQSMALRSRDPSTKVGAVVVQHNDDLAAAGWNHFPEGVPHSWYHDRPLKYKAIVHAEAWALIWSGHLAEGGTMHVTHHPCRDCAKLIVAAGIKCVVCPNEPWRMTPEIVDSVRDARELFDLCGVEMRTPDAV